LGPQLAVVLPARNEASRLGQVLRAIPAAIGPCGGVSALVVDDGSRDDTAAVARQAGAEVVRHVISLGKGAALRTGCDAAVDRGFDLIAVMDADGQHRPTDLAALVTPLACREADLSLTYRSFTGEMPATQRIGNWGLSGAFALLYGARFQDTQCGMRAFTASAYRRLRWLSSDYSVETEMLMRAARARLRVVEVPIETVYHDRYKGTTVSDGVRIFANMLRWRLPMAG